MRRAELVRLIEAVPVFPTPSAVLEQLATPAEAAATLLAAAERRDGLAGRSVIDLGCGTGRLAIGAAALGASPVLGIDLDAEAVAVAERAAARAGLRVDFRVEPVAPGAPRADLVVMNPPFGAQRRHADRPFWEAAFDRAGRSVYAFALSASRTFIARRAVERGVDVLEVAPVPWGLGRTLPHHRRARVPLEVDLWTIRTARTDERPRASRPRPAG